MRPPESTRPSEVYASSRTVYPTICGITTGRMALAFELSSGPSGTYSKSGSAIVFWKMATRKIARRSLLNASLGLTISDSPVIAADKLENVQNHYAARHIN